MKKILTVGLSLLPMSVFAQAMSYFQLPADFADNAKATLLQVGSVLVGIIAIYIAWRYFRAIFNKRG